MASLGTSSQSTRTRISLNSFLCYTGSLVNAVYIIVAVHFLKAIFNEGVYMCVLILVTDCQTDSLTNLIRCVVVYRSYSYTFWSTSLWAPVYTQLFINNYNSSICDFDYTILLKAILPLVLGMSLTVYTILNTSY